MTQEPSESQQPTLIQKSVHDMLAGLEPSLVEAIESKVYQVTAHELTWSITGGEFARIAQVVSLTADDTTTLTVDPRTGNLIIKTSKGSMMSFVLSK